MELRNLELTSYRNLSQVSCDFGPRFNVFSGQNGAGKTNLLEAIYLLSTLKSFRINDQSVLIQDETMESVIRARFYNHVAKLPENLAIRIRRGDKGARKTIYQNDKHQKSAIHVYGAFRAILFTPEDLGVLRGSPTQRRQFVDRVVFARDKQHIIDIQQYEKLLRSRNRLLKEQNALSPMHAPLFEAYENGLAETGSRIWKRRLELLREIEESFAEHYLSIQSVKVESDRKNNIPSIRYEARIFRGQSSPETPNSDYENKLRDQLAACRREDAYRKTTTIGPHLDDIVFEIGERNAQQYASQGQLRAIVLAFKVAELKLAKSLQQKPLLLLDDVSSELDPHRNAQFFELLSREAGQCVITTTDAKFLHTRDAERLDYHVENGRITPCLTPIGAPIASS